MRDMWFEEDVPVTHATKQSITYGNVSSHSISRFGNIL